MRAWCCALLTVVGLSLLNSTAFAQGPIDERMQQWFFYDANRSDQADLIASKHAIATARATLVDRQASYHRIEQLHERDAVSEDDFRRAKRDWQLAQIGVELSLKARDVFDTKFKISDLRWRWHTEDQDPDIGRLEELQFQLWDQQCVAVEIDSRHANSALEYAVYFETITRRLVERNAETQANLDLAVAKKAAAENRYQSLLEIYDACREGPPFKRRFSTSG